MPVCGIVPSRGWQIISVALEPKCFGDYCEAWDLIINKVQKVSRCGFFTCFQIQCRLKFYYSLQKLLNLILKMLN